MIASTTLQQTTRHAGNGALYVLILDAQGNPFALAPVERLPHNPFPAGQIRLIDGEGHVLEKGSDFPAPNESSSGESLVRQAERALKHLDDPVFLSEHPLAESKQVSARLEPRATRLERAKMLRTLLEQAIEQLRPAGPLPARTGVPRRDWHPYLILRYAYVEGEHNNAIMNWLQIGEGTFNRTRRRALDAIAKVFGELE